jgi:hypothetical protein
MHEKSRPLTLTVAQHMAREFRALVPFRLETDCAGGVWAASGLLDGCVGGEVNSEAVFPFLSGGFVDEVVWVVGVAGREGLGGSEGVVGCTVVSWRVLVLVWMDGGEGPITLRSEVY